MQLLSVIQPLHPVALTDQQRLIAINVFTFNLS